MSTPISKLLSLFILLSFCVIGCKKTTPKKLYDTKKAVIADKAMVISAHPLASKVGMDIIKAGGNAVDAAIAVQFALAVTYPVAGNIGGGGFMVIHMKNGETATLDFREKAPLAAHKDMYLDSLGNVIEGLSFNGHLAAGVPGTVDGMVKAFDRFSKLKNFQKLVAPSVALANNGFVVTEQQADRFNSFQERFKKFNTHTPVFIKTNSWKAGDVLIQKDLGNTLQKIHDNGEMGFYAGEVANKIVAEMEAGGGIITQEDLLKYDAKWRIPLKGNYKDYTIISMPPPSSGGIALLQLLEMVEPFPLTKMGFQSPETVHLIVESERRVYADRAKHLGDMDFYPVPVDSLLNGNYLAQRMKDFDPKNASVSDSIYAGNFNLKESEETTHFSIVDAEGNAVSVTTTINSGYGAKTVVNGAGFFLNNEMDDFSVKPGVPNFYGLVGAAANAIHPEKRMLSSMTPSILLKDNQLFMVVGTPGGSTIITSVFQTILNVVEFGMSAGEAVSARRFHHQWLPDAIQYEEGTFNQEQMEIMEKLGHQLKERGAIGRVEAIVITPDGKLDGGADPRGDDHAEGW